MGTAKILVLDDSAQPPYELAHVAVENERAAVAHDFGDGGVGEGDDGRAARHGFESG